MIYYVSSSHFASTPKRVCPQANQFTIEHTTCRRDIELFPKYMPSCDDRTTERRIDFHNKYVGLSSSTE